MKFDVKDSLTEQELRSGLKAVIRDGLASQAMATLSSGVFLVAFALQLGASNFVIGLLAAIPALTQLIQIPATYLVERYQRRRFISVHATLVGRVFLLIIALIPFVFSGKTAIFALVAALGLHTSIGAISLCAWNSWMRDLIPQKELGTFFSGRMRLQVVLGIVLNLAVAAYMYYWVRVVPKHEIYAYSILFALAYVAGMFGTYFISTIPEPRMRVRAANASFLKLLLQPFRDSNFRKLIGFLGSWNFAANLAAPFFIVYMLKRLNLDMSSVIGLTVLSQIMNMAFLRLWGRFSDRFSNKSVLGICAPLFVISILAWTFTTMPEKHILTIPLLIVIHILMGIAIAGVTLGTGNLALKLAPHGEATSYLATSSMVSSLAAGIAPILGGKFADFFARRELAWALSWKSSEGEFSFQTLNFQSWDFFFFLAFVIGIYAIHRLVLVKEEGEVKESIIIHELISVAMRPLRNFSSVGGLRHILHYHLPISRHNKGPNTPVT